MTSLLRLLCATLLFISLTSTAALNTNKPPAWRHTRSSTPLPTPSPPSPPWSAVHPYDNQRALPYPSPPLPSTVYVYNPDSYTPDDTFLLLTLQGSLARLNAYPSPAFPIHPLLYHVTGTNRTQPEWVYLAHYQRALPNVTFRTVFLGSPATTVITFFTGVISGAYVTALHTDSVNICVSLASLTPGSICATVAHLPLLKDLNITILQDLTNMTEAAFLDTHLTSHTAWPWSTRFISAQVPEKAVTSLSDWSMLIGAVQLHRTDSYQRVLRFLHTFHPTPLFNAVFGWVTDNSTEHDYTGQASSVDTGVLASDWLNNGSPHASLAGAWKGKGLTNPTKTDPSTLPDNTGKHTVSLLLTDGDNLCSDMNLLLDDTHWAHPKRGSVPIGWGLNPTLALTFPVGLQQYYDEAVPANDGFVAFSSLYAFPDYMTPEGVQQWAELSGQAMAAADMHVMNFIGNNFSVSSFAPLLNQWNVDGIVYFESAQHPHTHARTPAYHTFPLVEASAAPSFDAVCAVLCCVCTVTTATTCCLSPPTGV